MNDQCSEAPQAQEQVNRPVAFIRPTVGRVVWFWPQGKWNGGQPYAAVIAFVHSDRCVNIGYLDSNGVAENATSVALAQEGEPEPRGPFCEWMPYQKQVASGQIPPKLHANASSGGIGVG